MGGRRRTHKKRTLKAKTLRRMLKKKGMKTTGKKATLMKRLHMRGGAWDLGDAGSAEGLGDSYKDPTPAGNNPVTGYGQAGGRRRSRRSRRRE